MLSENIYTPYFYIIRHIPSQKLYAGSKWGIDANPDNFMISGGYTTSSPTINSIIESEGLYSFEILRIDTNCDGVHVYDYESIFLQCNNCAASDNWFNKHNNSGMSFGLEQFYKKSKETCLEKYGYEYILQVPEIRDNYKSIMIEKYGVDNISKSETIKQKKKQTSLENYGVEFPLQHSPDIVKKSKQTLLHIYGVDNASKSQTIKQKKKDKATEKYGDGIINVFQAEEVKSQIKQTNLEKYGVDNIAKVKFICIIETKKTYNKSYTTKLYPELKQYY